MHQLTYPFRPRLLRPRRPRGFRMHHADASDSARKGLEACIHPCSSNLSLDVCFIYKFQFKPLLTFSIPYNRRMYRSHSPLYSASVSDPGGGTVSAMPSAPHAPPPGERGPHPPPAPGIDAQEEEDADDGMGSTEDRTPSARRSLGNAVPPRGGRMMEERWKLFAPVADDGGRGGGHQRPSTFRTLPSLSCHSMESTATERRR